MYTQYCKNVKPIYLKLGHIVLGSQVPNKELNKMLIYSVCMY